MEIRVRAWLGLRVGARPDTPLWYLSARLDEYTAGGPEDPGELVLMRTAFHRSFAIEVVQEAPNIRFHVAESFRCTRVAQGQRCHGEFCDIVTRTVVYAVRARRAPRVRLRDYAWSMHPPVVATSGAGPLETWSRLQPLVLAEVERALRALG